MEDLIKKLHPLERKLIPFLVEGISFLDLVSRSGLKDIEVMRSLQWLSNKDIITLDKAEKEVICLSANGKKYSTSSLPEMRFLKELLRSGQLSKQELQEKAGLNDQEFGVSVGLLKKKVAITVENNNGLLRIGIAPNGRKLLEKETLEESFLKKTFPLLKESLSPEEKFAFDSLIHRKDIIRQELEKTITVKITATGKKLLSSKDILQEKVEDRLTHDMLKTGNWKDKKFRHYDININVPAISGGKRHFVKQSIDYIKRVWLDLGFKEMKGTHIQSAFWDLDALFVPQDHPARAMQDSFYIKDPSKAKLPLDIMDKIKAVHETGADTGSTGWRAGWSKEEASLNMLRTHTTVLSARTIASLKESDLPAKFFSVRKVFRNEALSWKHLFEFHQVEGIVVDPNANLKHLKGYLKNFYNKLGFEKVRMRPGHFPYTEPSLEVDVFHPGKQQWIELGGAGIFRPEVTKPLLGFECPVLAWGQGLERGIMDFYRFKDIRDLYSNDIKLIKEAKIWR
jgi:phenylalanyl-tRNA synthetase alpha chain